MKTYFYKILNKDKDVVYVGVTTRTINKRFKEHLISKGLNALEYSVIEFDSVEHPEINSLEVFYIERQKVVELEQRYIKEEIENSSNLLNISAGGEWGSKILDKLRKEEFLKEFGSYDNYDKCKKFINWLKAWISCRSNNKVKCWLGQWVRHRSDIKTKVWLRSWIQNRSTSKTKVWLQHWSHTRGQNKACTWLRSWVVNKSKSKTKAWTQHWIYHRSTPKTKTWLNNWKTHKSENITKAWLNNWIINNSQNKVKRWLRTWVMNRSRSKNNYKA